MIRSYNFLLMEYHQIHIIHDLQHDLTLNLLIIPIIYPSSVIYVLKPRIDAHLLS